MTKVDRLQDLVAGWDALAECASQARGGGGIVAAWAAHMLPSDTELRVWVASEGSAVVGVLPFVAEAMRRGRFRLLPPTTDLMFGTVPIAHPDGAERVADAVADDFVAHADAVDDGDHLLAAAGLPVEQRVGSPSGRARLGRGGTDAVRLVSTRASLPEWIRGWPRATRSSDRESVAGPGAPRKQGFRLVTTEDAGEIMERLPRLQCVLPPESGGPRRRGVPVRRRHDPDDRDGAGVVARRSIRAHGARERRRRHWSVAGRARRYENELLARRLRPGVVPLRARCGRSARVDSGGVAGRL